MYFKDCRVAKSHKLGEVVSKRCATIDFMEDMKGAIVIYPRKIPQFSKKGRCAFKFRIDG